MYWGFYFNFSIPSFSCKVRKGQILFVASPSRVCFLSVQVRQGVLALCMLCS